MIMIDAVWGINPGLCLWYSHLIYLVGLSKTVWSLVALTRLLPSKSSSVVVGLVWFISQ